MSITLPTGFFVTAAEMRDAGIRVNENISDHTIYRPETAAQLLERVALVIGFRESEVADGKCADSEGDTLVADSCRRRVAEIDEVLDTWRSRWRDRRKAK